MSTPTATVAKNPSRQDVRDAGLPLNPSSLEMDEFFATDEQQQHQHQTFRDKYNFCHASERPLPAMEWAGARLLGLSPHTTSSSRSSSIDLWYLGLDISAEAEKEHDRIKSFEEQELDAFQRVKRELFSDVPYFLIIDNLESERDWWEGKDLQDFIPRNTTFSLLSSFNLNNNSNTITAAAVWVDEQQQYGQASGKMRVDGNGSLSSTAAWEKQPLRAHGQGRRSNTGSRGRSRRKRASSWSTE
ncbi:hypothetical protein ZWY2020_035924 [Hordeum vulgare]|nr:hypothetical protein ZWY2020_035924 [Hordeum vulgare]